MSSIFDYLCQYGWDNWWDDESTAPKKKEEPKNEPCRSAYMHSFEETILLHVRHDICKKCGYSPSLSIKPGFEQCHKDYMEYKGKLK